MRTFDPYEANLFYVPDLAFGTTGNNGPLERPLLRVVRPAPLTLRLCGAGAVGLMGFDGGADTVHQDALSVLGHAEWQRPRVLDAGGPGGSGPEPPAGVASRVECLLGMLREAPLPAGPVPAA